MNTALTPLGKMLRKLRIDAGERIADVASVLRCTPSFISAIELGKKSPPSDFLQKIFVHYALDDQNQKELRDAAIQSTAAVQIDLKDGSNDLSKELAVAFARAFPTIDRAHASELLRTLSRSNRGE